jgi:hypothetical protein
MNGCRRPGHVLALRTTVAPNRLLALVLAAPALIGLAACQSSRPTEPRVDGPHITSVTPQSPVQSDAPQLLIVRGEQFPTGLSLVVAAPDNSTRIYSNSEIEGLQQGTFQVQVVLARPGIYTLTPRSPGASVASPGFQLQVSSAGSTPVISSISPSALSRNTLSQSVAAQGNNFDAGLTVTVIEPDGATVSLGAGNVIVSSPTAFQIFHVFNKVGTYTLRASNPDGTSSNTVSLLVGQ